MKSFHLYLGRLGLLLGQYACYRARRSTGNRQRRWYRLAMWSYEHSSPLGLILALTVGIECSMIQMLATVASDDAINAARADMDYADRVDRPEIGF